MSEQDKPCRCVAQIMAAATLIPDLEADRQRLRQQLADADLAFTEGCAALEAENARLREALKARRRLWRGGTR